MASRPSTPVRVPKAAATYSPQSQDPDLRSQINTVLLRDGHIEKIQQVLHHALHAHPSNWPARISSHALDLLRSGECATFPKLMERVMADVRHDTEEAKVNPAAAGVILPPSVTAGSGVGGTAGGKANGLLQQQQQQQLKKGKGTLGLTNGTGATGTVANGGVRPGGSLAVPKGVVDEAIKVTRECLELVCEIDD